MGFLGKMFGKKEEKKPSIVQSKLEERLETINKAIRLEPDNPSNHYNKAEVLGKMKRFKEALEECDVAIGLKPDECDYHSDKAQFLFELGRYVEALRECDVAIGLKPDDFFSHTVKENVLLKMGKQEEAQKEEEIALLGTDVTREAHFHNSKALSLCASGRYEEALRECDIAIGLRPNDPFFHSTKSIVLGMMRTHKEAQKERETAKKL